jgi:hypothetical protein
MLVTPHKRPLRFNPSEETAEKGEEAINQGFMDTFHEIQDTVLKDSGHAERAVHAKAWGLFEGELTVFDDLLPDYAQGLFANAGAVHPVILRLSSIPGDILDDEITVPHGLAVKVLNVEGERLPGSEGDTTQDFVLVNGPAFNTPNAKMFLANLKLLSATTDKAEGLKKGASVVNRALEAVIEAFGGESRTLKSMGGAPMTHPLGDVFYSQTAFRYGDHVAKFSVAPVSPNLVALSDKTVDVKGRPDGFREIVADEIARNGGEWAVRVQLRTDDKSMPIEDASKAWSQDDSPFLPVASIKVAPQTAYSDQHAAADDALSFSVWHGIAAHQPLGSVNRCRKDSYKAAADFRCRANGCPMHEPQAPLSLG